MEFPNKKTQFKPGISGNRNGRPKGSKNRSTIVRQILEMDCTLPDEILQTLKEEFPDIINRLTIEEVMTIIQVREAIVNGNTSAYKAVMDSAYGQPTQDFNFDRPEITGIEFRVIDSRRDELISESENNPV